MRTASISVTHVALSQLAQNAIGRRVEANPYKISQKFGGILMASIFIACTAWLNSYSLPPYVSGFFRISVTIWIFLILSIFLSSYVAAKDGVIRYRSGSRQVWVSQTPLLGRFTALGLALVITALAVYSVVFVVVGIAQNGGNVWGAAPRSAWVLGTISIGLGVYGWRETHRVFRANIGVRLAPDRVGINHEHRDLFLYWKQIETVAVEAVNKGAGRKKRMVSCVRIDAEDGRVFHVDVVELGSDPNVVAALMRYYLDRPQERHLLTNPEEAIRRFSEAQSLT